MSKPKMKTITEFQGIHLKNAAKLKADLIKAGKTPEELPAALGEALKLDPTRLGFLTNALDLVGTKLTDLKRAIVYTSQEGEKAPQGLVQKEDHFYLVEYFPSLAKPNRGRGSDDRNHDRSRRGDRDRKGKGRGRTNRGDGRTAGPRIQQDSRPPHEASGTPLPVEGSGPLREQDTQRRPPRRRPRNPNSRGPRPTPSVQSGPPIIIKPLTPIVKVATPAPTALPSEAEAPTTPQKETTEAK